MRAKVMANVVVKFVRNMFNQLFPSIRHELLGILKKPFQVAVSTKKGISKNGCTESLRVLAGIRQGKAASP
jgi:hypothetical protein